jgi:hypothetical protein
LPCCSQEMKGIWKGHHEVVGSRYQMLK